MGLNLNDSPDKTLNMPYVNNHLLAIDQRNSANALTTLGGDAMRMNSMQVLTLDRNAVNGGSAEELPKAESSRNKSAI